MHLLAIAGARPNFVKIAALYHAFSNRTGARLEIVHTGQHYDTALSELFFRQLQLPSPDFQLHMGADTPGRQLGRMLLELDAVLARTRPDAVVVVGDTTSTLAGALAANRAGLPLAHVEAGLRAHDRSMPEEHNRRLTDALADWHFITEKIAEKNLTEENISTKNTHLVGNCMIDTLLRRRPAAEALGTARGLGLKPGQYVLATLHRPANVDRPQELERMVNLLRAAARVAPVVWPLHPRTRQRLEQFGLSAAVAATPGLRPIEPQGYLEFLNLLLHAGAVLTDSGGVQEETTFLGIPCITLRPNTERPVTVELGTNVLAPQPTVERLSVLLDEALNGRWKPGVVPPFWDGESGNRIARILLGEGA